MSDISLREFRDAWNAKKVYDADIVHDRICQALMTVVAIGSAAGASVMKLLADNPDKNALMTLCAGTAAATFLAGRFEKSAHDSSAQKRRYDKTVALYLNNRLSIDHQDFFDQNEIDVDVRTYPYVPYREQTAIGPEDVQLSNVARCIDTLTRNTVRAYQLVMYLL